MWELDCKEGWVPKNWCFPTVVLEKTLEDPLDCKKIQPVHPKGNQSWIFTGGLMLKLSRANWHEMPTYWERPWCWERLRAGGEGGDRGWDGWMASLTRWTRAWASSERWWRTRKPGVLQSMGLQRVGMWMNEWITTTTQACWWFLGHRVQILRFYRLKRPGGGGSILFKLGRMWWKVTESELFFRINTWRYRCLAWRKRKRSYYLQTVESYSSIFWADSQITPMGRKIKTSHSGILIWAGHKEEFSTVWWKWALWSFRATQPWRKEADGELFTAWQGIYKGTLIEMSS